MIAQVMEVIAWHYSSTQVGAISHSREENKPVFKLLWMFIFFIGLALTFRGLFDLVTKIQKYEVNTAINVEKRTFLEFPAVTLCNNNLIHCQHLFDMIAECEKDSSPCPKREIYCNMYVLGNCKVTPIVGGSGNPVCIGHTFDIATQINGTYDFKTDRALLFDIWFLSLSTDEMKKLAHQPCRTVLS